MDCMDDDEWIRIELQYLQLLLLVYSGMYILPTVYAIIINIPFQASDHRASTGHCGARLENLVIP